MKRVSLVFLFVILSVQGFSQNHGDCASAIELKDVKLIINELEGQGNVLEISGNALGNGMYFTEEHNTVWITFKARYDGELSFDIIPKVANDDWDFILFQASLDQCAQIKDKTIKPVRSNLARNDDKNGGVTGLRPDANKEFVAAGVNSNFSKSILVEENQSFILAIDIHDANKNGFELKRMNDKLEIESNIEEVAPSAGFDFVDMSAPDLKEEKIHLNFIVLVEGTNKQIECNAELIGANSNIEKQEYTGISNFGVDVPKDEWFYVNVKKDGYTFGTEKFKATDELNGSTQKIYISEVKEGNRIILKEIVFRENTTQLLPSSINALQQLIDFMNEYPNARIEIQGHVNAPGYDNDGKVKKFSLKRAEQIKIFLIDAGIDGKRIQIAGMGNEFMIHPNPKNYEEEKANRRVEIEILSL